MLDIGLWLHLSSCNTTLDACLVRCLLLAFFLWTECQCRASALGIGRVGNNPRQESVPLNMAAGEGRVRRERAGGL